MRAHDAYFLFIYWIWDKSWRFYISFGQFLLFQKYTNAGWLSKHSLLKLDYDKRRLVEIVAYAKNLQINGFIAAKNTPYRNKTRNNQIDGQNSKRNDCLMRKT